MKRRDLFKRVAAVAAAVAAVAVVPAVEAEAAPACIDCVPEVTDCPRCADEFQRGYGIGVSHWTPPAPALTFNADTDTGYYTPDGKTVHRAENGVDMGAVTFEAMQQDCAARGCHIDTWLSIEELLTSGGMPYRATHWADSDADNVAARQSVKPDLSALDAWRRSLHEQGEGTA